MIPTTTQYADANEAKQLTEDEASEAHVSIIIRDYLIPLFGFEVERSWSDPDWIALERPGPLRGCGFDGSPMIGLLDRRLHEIQSRPAQVAAAVVLGRIA